MIEGKAVVSALKLIGNWFAKNPDLALGAVDIAAKLPFGKKAANIEEQVHVIDAKATQVGAAVLELKDKVDNEIAHL